ncbi:hypothetical protein BDU57DRAFT_513521 [Ampelomyces quisqualis]|uniref:Uncharacterized protein n=1 Tax=Ampelomyces quisqualis TaxID=50730 RepID=A0A6A5QNG4_AMPQU|nr:hypothetical protein BDU57DRAFT_513521 [Ampelomyces quisqualis]
MPGPLLSLSALSVIPCRPLLHKLSLTLPVYPARTRHQLSNAVPNQHFASSLIPTPTPRWRCNRRRATLPTIETQKARC